MGNRAVITKCIEGMSVEDFEKGIKKHTINNVGVYLHWNGGIESVKVFLMYCKMKDYRTPKEDEPYAFARLCQVISNFFGGSISIGVGNISYLDCDNYNNGVYLIDDWDIKQRAFNHGYEDTNNEDEIEQQEEFLDFLIEVDNNQPVREQLGKEKIKELLEQYTSSSF